MLEYEKFQELQGKSQCMQEDYDQQLTEMEQKREHDLQELIDNYENKLQELHTKLEQVPLISNHFISAECRLQQLLCHIVCYGVIAICYRILPTCPTQCTIHQCLAY